MNQGIKKNLLDLYYYKNLQYKNTTIIIMFTYIIAVIVAFLTKQLKITELFDIALIVTLSIAVLGVSLLFLNEFNNHLKKIPDEIKNLS